ncbi:MAG: tRNA (guanosine(46)-N7)-methyltransferase TrmB [Candidatus Cloacimonadota bacterium]|nr:MAG: tRNA (guanosine(46)-N7)-methyltransferase TrmB [Candidatus Cloacimonadota bacterium]
MDSRLFIQNLKKPQNFHDLFEKKQDLILDLGSGMGEFVIELAQSQPQFNYICVEKRMPRARAIVQRYEKRNLTNIIVIQTRFEWLIPHCFFNNHFHTIYLNFPDPWLKAKYSSKRSMTPQFLDYLSAALIPNGNFHFATDVDEYAEFGLNLLEDHPKFKNMLGEKIISKTPPEIQKTLFYYHAQKDNIDSNFIHFQKVK